MFLDFIKLTIKTNHHTTPYILIIVCQFKVKIQKGLLNPTLYVLKEFEMMNVLEKPYSCRFHLIWTSL